jgi:hypothetical protein
MTRTKSTITNMMVRTTPQWKQSEKVFRLCVTPFDNVPLRIVLEVQQQREGGRSSGGEFLSMWLNSGENPLIV